MLLFNCYQPFWLAPCPTRHWTNDETLSVALSVGSASEMENQCLPVRHRRHWESVGDCTGITHIFSMLGFQVHAWWNRVVSHG